MKFSHWLLGIWLMLSGLQATMHLHFADAHWVMGGLAFTAGLLMLIRK